MNGRHLYSEVALEDNNKLNKYISTGKVPIGNAIEIRKRFFDARIKDERQKGNIEKVKELICKEYFGVLVDELPSNMDSLSEKTKKAITCIKKISKSDSFTKIDEIVKLLDTSEFKQFDNTVVNEISNELKTEFLSRLTSFQNRQPIYKEYDGKMIPMYILRGEDFRGVIHATSDSKSIDAFEGSTGHLCTSEQSDIAYNFWTTGYRVGFIDLKNEELFENRGAANMGSGSKNSVLGKEKYYLEDLSFSRDAVEESSKKGAINEIDIKPKKPDYIFTIGSEEGTPKELLQLANKLKIPIVVMDSNSYFQKYKSLYEEKERFFKNSPRDLTLKDFEELYIYDRQRENFEKGSNMNSSIADNEIYKYKNFFKIFRNIELAQQNPAFYNDVFNFITNNNPYKIKELKEYISSEIGKDDNNDKETADSLFGKLEAIRQNYLDEREDESPTI